MMLLVGIELTKFARKMRLNKDLIPLGATVVVSLATNMAFGFLIGLVVYHLTKFVVRQTGHCVCHHKATNYV